MLTIHAAYKFRQLYKSGSSVFRLEELRAYFPGRNFFGELVLTFDADFLDDALYRTSLSQG